MDSPQTWQGPKWPERIARHRKFFINEEQRGFDLALDQYNGKYWTSAELARYGSRVSYNLVYAICESAYSALLPPNMRFSVVEIDDVPQLVVPDPELKLNQLMRRGCWAEEGKLALLSSILYGRWIYKVYMNGDNPVIRCLDPRRVYFDLTTQRTREIRYYIELVLMTPEEVQADPRFKLPEQYTGAAGLRRLKEMATVYPAWVSPAAAKTSDNMVQLWECWDNEHKCMSVWLDGDQYMPLFTVEGEAYYNPFILGNLNLNGIDCRGLSEVQLLKDVIVAINNLLTYATAIVRCQVPVTLYNKSIVTEDEAANIATALPGELIGISKALSAGEGAAMVPGPVASVPADIAELMAKLEQIVSYISALSDAARGQVTGARTATELALIKSEQRNRLQTRTDAFYAAFEDAAALALLMALKLPYSDLADMRERVQIVASNSAEVNRAVLQEKFQQIYQFVSSQPQTFDMEVFNKLFVEIYDLPPDALRMMTPDAAAMPGVPGVPGAEGITPEQLAAAEAELAVPAVTPPPTGQP